MRNSLYLNTGGKAFGEVAHMAGLAGTDWTWSVKFGDLDNDGWIDLIGTNGMSQDRTNSDFLNQAQALQTARAKRDFWRNSPPKKDENFIFRNLGGIFFQGFGKWGFDESRGKLRIGLGGFRPDGDLDAAVASMENPYLLIQERFARGATVLIRLMGGTETVGASVPRLDRNRTGKSLADLVILSRLRIRQRSASSFRLGESQSHQKNGSDLAQGEIQKFARPCGDMRYTVFQPDAGLSRSEITKIELPFFINETRQTFPTDMQHRENLVDDFSIQPLLPFRPSRFGPGLSAGDIAGDGNTDLFHGQGGGTGAQ